MCPCPGTASPPKQKRYHFHTTITSCDHKGFLVVTLLSVRCTSAPAHMSCSATLMTTHTGLEKGSASGGAHVRGIVSAEKNCIHNGRWPSSEATRRHFPLSIEGAILVVQPSKHMHVPRLRGLVSDIRGKWAWVLHPVVPVETPTTPTSPDHPP